MIDVVMVLVASAGIDLLYSKRISPLYGVVILAADLAAYVYVRTHGL